MGSRLNPYLNFKNSARQAMEFYQTVFGGDLSEMTFGEGGMSQDPAEKNLVMHAQLVVPNGYWLMAADTPAHMGTPSPNGSVSLSGDEDAALRGYWERLSGGATIRMPLEKAPWGDSFGMLVDKFGVPWLVNIAGQH